MKCKRIVFRIFILYSLFSMLLLSGCTVQDTLPYARQMEDMVLMRTMGMDMGTGGEVRVTVSSGVQSKGADKGDEPPLVLTKESGTVSGACMDMQSYGTAYIFYGHVGQLLLGEEMARQGLAQALDYVERDLEMRLDTRLFVVRDASAADAMFASAAQSASAADRLEAMEDDEGLDSAAVSRSVQDVLSDLDCGGASFVPAVTLRPQRAGDGSAGEAQMVSTGYAVFGGNGLIGWAEGEAARGVGLMLGEVEADILELAGPAGDKAALRVVGTRTKVRPDFDGDTITGLTVDCTVEANLAQAPAGISPWEETALDDLRKELERVEKARLEAVLTLSQELNADFLGLKKAVGLAAPWYWAALCDQWDSSFAALDIRVSVEGVIQRSYDMAGSASVGA